MREKTKRFGKAFLISSAIVLTFMAFGCSSDLSPADEAAKNWLALPDEGKRDMCLGLEIFGEDGMLELSHEEIGSDLTDDRVEVYYEVIKLAKEYCNG